MRKLQTADVMNFCRCAKRLGVKEQVRVLAEEANSAADLWSFGFDFVWNLFDLATEKNGEEELYKFLAGPFEMTPEEVRTLDLDILIPNLQQMVEENKLSVFFKSAARLMK